MDQGYFHLLDIVNNAAKKYESAIALQILFPFPLDIDTKADLLNHMVIFF